MAENKEVKLSVNNLKISFRTDGGNVQAVRDISFDVYKGETLAIVGESGSGKSVTNRAIMGILAGNAIKEGGEIIYDGQDLMKISEEEFHSIRGDKIAMIFQDPMSSLNPIMRVGKQLTEAMLIKGKLKQKQSRKDFNGTLSALKNSMNAAYGMNEADCQKNKTVCESFDKFEYKHLELENAYNQATVAANDALLDLDDALFRIEKNSYHGVRATVNEIVKLASCTYNEYVVNEDADRLKTLLAELKKLAALSIGDYISKGVSILFNRKMREDDMDFATVAEKLKEVKEILTKALEKVQPNFFALGYYFTFATDPLPELPTEELNAYLRKYLDEHFMFNFRERAQKGVAYSRERTMQARREAVALLKEHSKTFSGEHIDKKQAHESYLVLTKAVKKAIDPLEVVKDNLSYTFASGLNSAIEQYFSAIERNAKEEKRYATQKAKWDRLVASGKTPTYEVSEKNLVDVSAAQAAILRIFDKLIKHYEARLAETDFDVEAAVVAVIDYLKKKASGVAYRVTRELAKMRAIKLLKEVGIPDPIKRYSQYPFEFSGGMRQRIVIAIALSADPDILICDEPTTALDVTIQSQILELINKVKAERQLSVIFITHDLGVVANMADRVAVMYAGKLVEVGTADDVFYSPAHPYTWALLSSMPDLDAKEKLEAIPGTPPNMIYPPKGDAFAERNKYAMQIDFEMQPPMFQISDTHYAATWLLHPDAPKVEPPKAVTDRINRMKKTRSEANG